MSRLRYYSYFVLQYLGCKFDGRVESFSLINKEIDFLSVLKGDYVVNVTFSYSWLGIALLNYSCFNLY